MAALENAQRRLLALAAPIRRTEEVSVIDAVGRVTSKSVRTGMAPPMHLVSAEHDQLGQTDVLASNTRLEVSHVPMLIAAELGSVEVFSRLRVGVVTLVDEANEAKAHGSASATSNLATGATLTALLTRLGAQAFRTTCRVALRPPEVENLAQHLDTLLSKCDLILISGFLSPSQSEVVRSVLARGGEKATIEEFSVRPAGCVQIIAAGSTLAIAVSSHLDFAFSSFVTLVSPLVRRMQGRSDPLPVAASASLSFGLDPRLATTGIFRVCETIDPQTRRQLIQPCVGVGDSTSFARATGLAWRPLDLPLLHAESVAYYPFHQWLS